MPDSTIRTVEVRITRTLDGEPQVSVEGTLIIDHWEGDELDLVQLLMAGELAWEKGPEKVAIHLHAGKGWSGWLSVGKGET